MSVRSIQTALSITMLLQALLATGCAGIDLRVPRSSSAASEPSIVEDRAPQPVTAPPSPDQASTPTTTAKTSPIPTSIVAAVGSAPLSSPLGPQVSQYGENGEVMIRAFYATDRKVLRNSPRIKPKFGELSSDIYYSNSQQAALTYGVVHISVPLEGRKPGAIPTPNWLVLDFESPKKHFLMRGHRLFESPVGFFNELKNSATRKDTLKRRAFVFIHGFNASFEDAAFRTAQIMADTQLSAVPIFYTWASNATITGYVKDFARIQRTEPKLRGFLEKLGTAGDFDEIYVLAHSMGTYGTSRALADVFAAKPELRKVFKQIVIAAPDIDSELFQTVIAPKLLHPDTSVTMYVSSGDKALTASRGVNGEARLGDKLAGPIIIHGMETIDASNINTDFLGHSYIGQSRELLADLVLIFERGMPARSRPLLFEVKGKTGIYWTLR